MDKMFKYSSRFSKLSPEDLISGAEDYFRYCMETSRAMTRTGLALALGFQGISFLEKYGKKSEYERIVSWINTVIQEQRHQCLLDKKNRNVLGVIFDLKYNHQWRDDRYLVESEGPGFNVVVNLASNSQVKSVEAPKEPLRQLEDDSEKYLPIEKPGEIEG